MVTFCLKSVGYTNKSKGGGYAHTHIHTHRTFWETVSKLQLLGKSVANGTTL